MPSLGVWPDGVSASALRTIALLLLALVECGCWEGITRETLASILSVEGSAEISSDGGRSFSALRSAQTAGKGTILRTNAAAQLSVALLPNCLLHLGPDTSLEIVRLALTKDGNETGGDMRGRFAEVKLIHGRIFISHLWGGARARLAITTPTGEVSTPSNAGFWIEAVEGGTRVTCVSGWVEFQPSGAPASSRIPPGSIGQWPSAGDNLSPADTDLRGQDDLEQGIELEQQMRVLMRRQQDVLPR